MRTSSHIVLAALDEGDSAIVVLQPDAAGHFRIVEANETYIRLLRFPQQETLGMSLSRLHAPTTNLDTHKAMDEAMRAGKPMRGEIELLTRDQRALWFGFTLMPITDPATKCLHSVMLGRDITAKLRADREQAMLQGLLAAAYQKVNAAVLIVGPGGKILLANLAAETLTGYRAVELQGTSTRRLTDPGFQTAVDSAHERQLQTGETFELELLLVRKDAARTPIHLTSAIVPRADKQRYHVVTLRRIDLRTPAAEPAIDSAPSAVIGSIQFLGLDAVKATYGARWATMRDRLLLAAEGVLKRRLGPDDVFTRTADDGFNIWFKQGNEEDNAQRLARIGRQVRIMLLGELGEETPLTVSSFTATAQLDAASPQSAVMASVSQRLAVRRQEAEQQARDLVAQVMASQPRELALVRDCLGQPAQGAFVDLPAHLRGRFAAAMSLVGEAGADTDVELFRLGLALDATLEDISQGKKNTIFIAMPIGLFLNRRGRERFLEQWHGTPLPVQKRLIVMLTELPPDVSAARVKEIADLLRPIMKGVAIELDDIDTPPFVLPNVPFSIVGLVTETLAGLPDAKLQAFTAKMRQAKARVLVRLPEGEPLKRWNQLGADLTAPF